MLQKKQKYEVETMAEYKFSNKNNPKDMNLYCPSCDEMVTQADIETYMHCPYCNRRFNHSLEIEDFILAPVVHRWVSQHFDIKHDGVHGFGFRVGR